MQNKNRKLATSASGKLFIVATPIGNLADISLRALEILNMVDLILCEDSRVTNILLKHYQIAKSLLIYNDHSDEKLRDKILTHLQEGKNLALVSDAGTPLISDPGYKLVQFLQNNKIEITTIPGASSVIAALTIAGIATDRFMFMGFLPHKKNSKNNIFEEIQSVKSTLVFFESSNRLLETLEIANHWFSNREIAVVKELTKIYEEVIKGNCLSLSEYFIQNPEKLRGEIVIIFSPPNEETIISNEEITQKLGKLMTEMSLKDAVNIASKQYPLPKKLLYKLALTIK